MAYEAINISPRKVRKPMIRWGNEKRKEGNKTFSSHELPLVPSVIFTFTQGVRFIRHLRLN